MDRNFIRKIIIGVVALLVIIFIINRLLVFLNSGNDDALAEGLSYLSELENRDVALINEEILAANEAKESSEAAPTLGADSTSTADGVSDDDGTSIVVDISETDGDSTETKSTDTDLSSGEENLDNSEADASSESEAAATETATIDITTDTFVAAWKAQIDSGNITTLTEEERASYRSRLSSCAVIGDSMAQAALEYGFLDSSHVFYRRGYAIGQLDDAIDEALAMYPTTIVFFTGLNDTDYYSEPEFYAAMYLEKIQYVQSSLPNANVYVCSMLPPSDALGAVRSDLARAPLYDAALKNICEENGINYIDTTWMVNQSLYMADGIHFLSEFYDIWIQYVAYCTGL